jgi:hypothetical protein
MQVNETNRHAAMLHRIGKYLQPATLLSTAAADLDVYRNRYPGTSALFYYFSSPPPHLISIFKSWVSEIGIAQLSKRIEVVVTILFT